MHRRLLLHLSQKTMKHLLFLPCLPQLLQHLDVPATHAPKLHEPPARTCQSVLVNKQVHPSTPFVKTKWPLHQLKPVWKIRTRLHPPIARRKTLGVAHLHLSDPALSLRHRKALVVHEPQDALLLHLLQVLLRQDRRELDSLGPQLDGVLVAHEAESVECGLADE